MKNILLTLLLLSPLAFAEDSYIQLSCKSVGMENIDYINQGLRDGTMDKKNFEDFDYELCQVNRYSINRTFTFTKESLEKTNSEAEYSLQTLCGVREEFVPSVKMEILSTKILFHIQPEVLGPLTVDRKNLTTPKWGAVKYNCSFSELEENKL